jgi:muconolactone delta-isomerase
LAQSESYTLQEETVQYLAQMKLVDSARPTNPEEAIAFINRYVFPTLDVCDKLSQEKKIVAGGPLGGAIALAVVVEAQSIQELDDILESLPVWPMMQTTVTPLTTFAGRRDAGRRRLEGEVRRAAG